MPDFDTFLTTLYVMVDDFCKREYPELPQPGPQAKLSRAEVVTLAMLAQHYRYRSERDFYRFALRHLRPAFPRLPERSQFNRAVRDDHLVLIAFGLYLAALLRPSQVRYEAVDSTAVPTRNLKRAGRGWLPGLADIGHSSRLGWYEGFHLLVACDPSGVITGYGFGPGSSKDQNLAESLLWARANTDPRLPSAGEEHSGWYVADKGFEGQQRHERWHDEYKAEVVNAPRRTSKQAWSAAWETWLASKRQMIETVFGKLQGYLRLGQDRPHDLSGFKARLAATISLHNFCIWFNEQLGRARLAFAELLAW